VELIFFQIFENFFITYSRSIGHDPCSSVGIFRLTDSEPEVAIFPRSVRGSGLVPETILLHCERRVDRRLNHVSISFRSGSVLSEGRDYEIFPIPRRKNRKNR